MENDRKPLDFVFRWIQNGAHKEVERHPPSRRLNTLCERPSTSEQRGALEGQVSKEAERTRR